MSIYHCFSCHPIDMIMMPLVKIVSLYLISGGSFYFRWLYAGQETFHQIPYNMLSFKLRLHLYDFISKALTTNQIDFKCLIPSSTANNKKKKNSNKSQYDMYKLWLNNHEVPSSGPGT